MEDGLTLYPFIDTLDQHIFGRWTFVRLMLCGLLFLYRYISEKKTDKVSLPPKRHKEIPQVSKEEALREFLIQIQELEAKIGSDVTQSRYREYQQLLRAGVSLAYDIDIQSVTLQDIPLAQIGLKKRFVELLRESYYIPYNVEQRNEQRMKEDIEKLKKEFK